MTQTTTARAVPVGPATTAGLAGAAAAFVGAVVAATQGLTPEAITATVTAGLTLLAVLGGRYAQAAARAQGAARYAAPILAATATHELPEGVDPDPVDAELDHGKHLADDADEVGLDPAGLAPTPADQVPPDEGDYGAAGEQLSAGGGR